MALSKSQWTQISDILRTSIRRKLANYRPEPNSMPFHTRLLGKDRLALFSFIQSLNTNFGTTIFEPVAVELASVRFKNVERQKHPGERISDQAQIEIQLILDALGTASSEPSKPNEVERIRRVCRKDRMIHVNKTKIDLAVGNDKEVFFFDIKTAKPNAGDFKEFKRMLLEWVAVALADNPDLHVNTAIAIPYNPYAPKPYSRWTIRGMLDLKHELFVADEFWDFLGGPGTYNELLKIFESVGIEMRPELDTAFGSFG